MDFKKISDMLSLGVPVLVVCSCVRLLTYFQHWNIPIFDYLSVSELLMLFIQPILVISALGMTYLAGNLAVVVVVGLATLLWKVVAPVWNRVAPFRKKVVLLW